MNEMKALIDPEHDLASGALAANALVGLVKKAGLARKFGGEKEHLFYEAWQALAKFHNCSIRTLDAVPVEINGIHGAKARAEVIDDSTGMVVGGAEAYCLRDEKNWANKPWFQLASMAQTRAGSKASRNKWAFIPVMVGYAATPAEEMDEVHTNGSKPPDRQALKDTKPQDAPGSTISPPPIPGQGGKKPEHPDLISIAQAGRFYAIAKKIGASDEGIKAWLDQEYHLKSTKDIPRILYEEICSRVVADLSDKGGE